MNPKNNLLKESKKSKLNKVLQMNFRRYLPGFLVALGGCLIVSVAAAFIEYGFALSDVKIQTSFVRYGVTDAFQTCFTVIFFLVLLYDVIAPAHYFSEIYSKRACDSYFAAPIKRADRFNAAFIMGAVVNIAAPLLPAASFFAFKFGGVPDKFEFSIDTVLVNRYTVFAVAALLSVWAVFMLCAVIAGRLVQYLVLCGISSSFVLISALGVASRLNLVWGIKADLNAVASITPIGALFSGINTVETTYRALKICIPVSIVTVVLFYVAGLLAFKRRSSEVAESTLSGKIVPYAFLALFAFGGFVFFQASQSFLKTAAVGIAAAVINGLIFCAVFYKKAYTKQGAISVAATVAVGLVLLAFSYFPPEKSFVSYVPEAGSVKSAVLEVKNYSHGDAVPLVQYIGNVLYVGYSNEDNSYTITEPENIEKLVALHEKTVSDEARKKTAAYYRSLENEDVDYVDYVDYVDHDVLNSDDGIIGFAVKYTLKNGKTVTRRYEVSGLTVIDEYVAAVQNKEVLNQTSLNEENFKNIYFSYFSYYQNDELGFYEKAETETSDVSSAYHDSYNNRLTAEQAEKLRELLIEDRLNETKYEFVETQGELFSITPPYYRQVFPALEGVLCNYIFSPELSEEKRSELMAVEEEKRSSIIRSYEAGEQGCMDESGCYLFESKSYEILPYDSNSCEYLKTLGLKLK